MTAQRQVLRLGIVSGALILGMASSGSAFADDPACESKGGVVTTVVGGVCRTLNATASDSPATADGVSKGTTSGLTADTRTATGLMSETAGQTAKRIDGTRSASEESGRRPTNSRREPAPAHDRVGHNVRPAGRALDTSSIAGLQPPPMTAGTQGNQPTVQLPKIAPAPQKVRLSAAEPNPTHGLGWVILIAAGSGAIGLIGGGHIGLLAARTRRRQA
jgi:hypothetical protein